ncbi:MAG: lysozyme inhibitor LprI family protein [Allosphingosinicella sp.]
MISLVMALALQCSLQAQAREHHCDDPQAQADMNACASIDFHVADAELNRLWPRVVAAARAADAELDREFDQRPTEEATLREAQRAWLVFRDAHCTVEGYHEARGGSMEPMIYDGCRAQLTRARIAQLDPQPVPDE